MKKKPKLSKSQNRKLKKLEEEKEKEILLSKSIETLEKHKIREDVYSLMWSSRNLGQVETLREKWRREVAFSKVGLELQDTDQPFTKRKRDNASHNIEVEVYENKIYSPAINVQSSDNGPVASDGSGGVLVEEVVNDTIQSSVPEFPQKSTHSPQNEEIIKPAVSNYSISHI